MKRQPVTILLAASLLSSCTRSIELGSNFLSTDAAVDSDAGVDATADAATDSCIATRYACGDCLDNDADGLVDGRDPECLSPWDDTEDTYYNPALGQKDATCKLDCYFDGDNGSGNDDCHWSSRCDPLSKAPDYWPSGDSQCAYDAAATVPGTDLACDTLQAEQSQMCIDSCLPLTPVGCDCFGCCELPRGSKHYVWIGSAIDGVGSCDSKSLSDASRCRPCTPILACQRQ